MLARHARLTKQDPIGLILRRGGLAHSPHLIARFQKNHLNHNRFTVIVSAKIYAKAVQRNRLRRQIYEIVRLYEKKRLHASPHFNIVILPKKSITMVKCYQEIQKSFEHLIPFIR